MKQKLKSVLLIDDNPATNFFNKKLIESDDCTEQVIVCPNGKEAVNVLTKSLVGEIELCPGLILLDLNMPVMNGWEFLDEYSKFDETLRKEIKVVMLTTSLNNDDKVKSKEKGADGYMIKPLNKQELREFLEKNMPQS